MIYFLTSPAFPHSAHPQALRRAFSQVYQEQLDVSLKGSQLFTNDAHDRSFVGILVERGLPQIKALIAVVDKVLKGSDLPVYYKDSKPHATVAWAVGDWRDRVDQGELSSFERMSDSEELSFLVRKVECKIGNRYYGIALGGKKAKAKKNYSRYKAR